MKVSSQNQTQATQHNHIVDELQNRMQQAQQDISSAENKAAEQYSMGVQSGGAEEGALPTQEEHLISLEQDASRLDTEIALMEQMVGDAEYYLLNFGLEMTEEQRTALIDVVAQGKGMLASKYRQREGLQQNIDMTTLFGTNADIDGDGLTNVWEQANGADALNVDTDGDGLSDAIERALTNEGIDSHWNMADTNNNGVTDYLENFDPAADLADHAGVLNWNFGPNGGGSAMGGFSDPTSGGDSSSDNSSDSNSGSDTNAPTGTQPSDSAHEIDLSEDASEEETVEEASAQSDGGMGVQTSDGTEGEMSLQADGDDAETEARSKTEIKDDLIDPSHYNADNTEVVVDDLNEFEDGYEDVVITLPDGDDEFVVHQVDNDLFIYIKHEDGTYKKIEIPNGVFRRIFMQDAGGQDTAVYYNVDFRVLHGATGVKQGEHQYVSGFFVEEATSGGFESITNSGAEIENEEEDPFSWDADPVETEAEEETEVETEPESPGIEKVMTLHDFARNEDGTPSDSLTKGDPFLEPESQGSDHYMVETWELDASGQPVNYHIPDVVGNQTVREVKVSEEVDGGHHNMVIVLKNKNGDVLKKIVIVDGVTNGNGGSGGFNDRVTFKLPNSLNDILGEYEEGMPGGVKFNAAGLDSNYVTVEGGDGHDWIIGSNFDGAAGSQYDKIFGGLGDDIIEGGKSGLHAEGGAGYDSILGTAENDILYGGDDGDFIHGVAGADMLYGEEGDDFIVTDFSKEDSENTYIEGGSGVDTTNGWEENEEGITVADDVERTSDNIDAGGINDLINMLSGIGGGEIDPEVVQDIEDAISGLQDQSRDMVADQIADLFHTAHSARKTAFWNGGDTTPPNYGEANFGEEEDPAAEGEGADA